MPRWFFTLLLSMIPAAAQASVCESDLAERIVVWRAPSRSAEMSERDFDQAREAIEYYNREIFASLSKPRIFEITHKPPRLMEDYTRVMFRISLGERVDRVHKWNRDSASKEWLGFHQLRALLIRQENIGREIAILTDLLSSVKPGPRAQAYSSWKADLENENKSVRDEILRTEEWMQIRLPEDQMLPLLQEFLVDFVKVMAAEDDILMREAAAKFVFKRGPLSRARQLLARTLLSDVSVHSPRSAYTQVVMKALMSAAEASLEEWPERPANICDTLMTGLRFYMRQHEVALN